MILNTGDYLIMYDTIIEANESTVVTEYTPVEKNAKSFQSKAYS